MNLSLMTTTALTDALSDAHARGASNETMTALEEAIDAREPNSHCCPRCKALTDGGPCPHHNLATEEITMGPGFGIHR